MARRPCGVSRDGKLTWRVRVVGYKKAGVVEHLEVFDHAGLLLNEPPGMAELPFVQSSDDFDQFMNGGGLQFVRAPLGINYTARTGESK